MFDDIKVITEHVAKVSGIKFVNWNTHKAFNSDNLPAFVIENVFRTYDRINKMAINPIYRRRWSVQCYIITRSNINTSTFDTLVQNVLRVGRDIVANREFTAHSAGGNIGNDVANYKFNDFEGVQRSILDGLEVIIYPFKMEFLQNDKVNY